MRKVFLNFIIFNILSNIFLGSCFIILLLASACQIEIRGLVSNSQRAKKEAPEFIQSLDYSTSVGTANYREEQPVRVVQAKDIKACITRQSKILIYQWAPHCKSNGCYLPDVLQTWCTENEVDLYLIAEYYDWAYLLKPYGLEKPILMVDHKYYTTTWINGYFSKFYQELIGRKRTKKEWSRYHV
jgi:hypothetical protein